MQLKIGPFVFDLDGQFAIAVVSACVGGGIIYGGFQVLEFFEAQAQEINQRIARIEEKLDLNGQLIAELSTQDAVVEFKAGRSYADEPVLVGVDVALNYVARRTPLGVSCDLREMLPVFEDLRNIPIPSKVVAGYNIDSSWTPLKIFVEQPDSLMPGLIFITLHSRYDCGGRAVLEESPTIRVQLTRKIT